MSRAGKEIAEVQPRSPERANAWRLWKDLATEDAVANEADKARMIERHKIVVNIIDVNSQQLRCESAIAGVDIERATALREVQSDNPASEATSRLAALDKRMADLSNESQRLATQREFLNSSLAEFDAATGRGTDSEPEPPVGRA